MVGFCSITPWLEALLNEKFFEPCLVHTDSCDKKTEKNLFCFNCCTSVCPKCLFRHRKHVLLQVRRYVYNDVLKLADAEKLIDCSGVQAYITNNAKVVFLRQRPVTRLMKSPANSCFTCNRNLQEPFFFCCLSCKVEHMIATQGSVKMKVSDHNMLGFSDMDEFQVVTPDSVLDSAGSIPTSSGSTSSSDLRTALLCTATTEIVRKKRSNLSARQGSNRESVCPEPVADHNSMNRRKKGVPNRSPLS
ncbi:protein RGF1 INDUCIBLE TRANSCRIPTION FACTOR 1 [Beta vulgaris subsp. vulgaris]|uniref:protein RGF1 INDUCIBLE TRANSCRIPTION FACTOR 1 n=1 Tax=Beta vulgaris subsp. vulgaris TaxID=3555 RepID=UPI0020367848|nr:protein RGF1 INDUCIBLE TRANSCRIPTION FACTOR 1 [Beta vulgaris subsp. vulgaris]